MQIASNVVSDVAGCSLALAPVDGTLKWRPRVKETDLVEYIAKSLVDHPDKVSVKEIRGSNVTVLELHVEREDMGRVIGKDGRVANAMRTLLKVATHDERRVVLEIV